MKNERKRLILFRIIQQSKCCLKRKALKLDLKDENDGLCEREGEGIPHLSGWVQYNTIQLYCLCIEKFAFWHVIYIKTFSKINNKTPTTQWNTELKNAQIQGKYLTITMYIYARTHAPPTHTHTHTRALFFWFTNNLKHSINYNKTKFLKQQNTQSTTTYKL